MYEMIFWQNGKQKKVYPQNLQEYALAVSVAGCNFISIEKGNRKVFHAGYEKLLEFIKQKEDLFEVYDVTDEMEENWIEYIIDDPYCEDVDMAYYALCQAKGFIAANKYLKEMQA